MTESDLQTAITRDGVNLRYLDIGGGTRPTFFVHDWCCTRAVTHTASTEEISSRYGDLPVAEVNAAYFLQMEQSAETNRIIRKFVEGLE